MNPTDVAHLSPEEKRALLKRLLAERAATGAGDYPLSYGQRALWFLQQLQPENVAYNVSVAVRLRPGLDFAALQQAFDQLVVRHPALRTRFPERDGEPIQRVMPPSPVQIRVVDATGLSEEALFEAVNADYQRPFVLDEPLLAVSLYRRSDDDVLLINVHHMVFDAWSLQVCFEDLRALYDAALTGAAPQLPPLTARYQDFVASQATTLASAHGDALWQYWSAQLTPPSPSLEIAGTLPRPAMTTLRGASVPFTIDAEQTAALHAVAKQHQTTLYAVMLAALQITLRQFTGESDITIGTPVSLRSRSEWANVIGYFINMMPVRSHVPAEGSFRTHLAQVREVALGALAHQEFPFPLLVDRLKVRREPNRSPLFQVMLNVYVSPRTNELGKLFAPGEDTSIRFGGSMLTPYSVPQQEGQFELVIEVADSDGVLHGNLKYQTDLYTPATASQVIETYQGVLAAVAEDAGVEIAELDSLGRDDFVL